MSHAARALTPPASADGAPSPQVPQVREVWIRTRAEASPCVFGLTGAERLRRILRSIATNGGFSIRLHEGEKAPTSGPALGAGGSPTRQAESEDAPILVFRGDAIYDERVVAGLLAKRDTALVGHGDGPPLAAHVPASQLPAVERWLLQEGPPPTRARLAAPEDLAPAYTPRLRKRQPPFAFPLQRGEEKRVEKALFDAAYKGVTDVVTRYLWPRPALGLTAALARAGIAPNLVTLASWVLVAGALVAFAFGAFLPGLACAWLMTFLDTVDGKLARVTFRSSRVGHVLDHGLDLLHPPFWYAAWGMALASGGPAWIPAATWITVIGYVLGRAEEGIFLARFGFEIHSWRRLDSRFRLITARRNPNLLLLSAGTLAGRPDLGLAAVAAWTLASLLFHGVRVGQAFARVRRGAAVRPWKAGPDSPAPAEAA